MNQELTFRQVLDGVGTALRGAYPNAAIFRNRTLQSVTPGSFNVIPVSAEPLEQLGKRRRYLLTLDVIYYPDEADAVGDCLRVQTDLPLLLETITAPSGAKLHAGDLVMNTADNVLHCIAQFDYFVFAERVTVDDDGNEIGHTVHGDLDDTDLMRILEMQKGQCT
ncbi:MAG: hypothetical protein IKN72_03705 [Clostridia bacterium]|nr:hypothetical protein [Clostridia bacterium]